MDFFLNKDFPCKDCARKNPLSGFLDCFHFALLVIGFRSSFAMTVAVVSTVIASEAKQSREEAIQKNKLAFCIRIIPTFVSSFICVMEKHGYTYILFNKRNGTLYVGMTSNLKQRVYEHKTRLHPDSFTARYSVDKLGYYE